MLYFSGLNFNLVISEDFAAAALQRNACLPSYESVAPRLRRPERADPPRVKLSK